MKLSEAALAQVVILGDTSLPQTSRKMHQIDAAQAIQSRYKFLQIPKTVDEFNINNGVSFFGGSFNNHPIDKLVIYTNGVLCESRLSTEDLEPFADDLLAWAMKETGIDVPHNGARAYLSNIEIESKIELDEKFEKFAALGKIISAILCSYGQSPKDFTFSKLALHCDLTDVPVPKASNFTFERRDGLPYGDHRYFSSSPLRTKDQLAILNELEALLIG